MLRRIIAAVGFAGLSLVGGLGQAQEAPRRRPPVVVVRPPPAPAPVRLRVEDDSGRGLPTFDHLSRRYVLGSIGSRYRIRVTNPTASRVEAVVSVDGLDVIDGLTASVGKRGYVVPAFGDVVIDGFRTSRDSVAAFRFSSVADSYAGRKDQDRNVGVIGVAIFRERAEPMPLEIPRPRPRRSATAPRAQGEDSASGARPGLGTEFGEEHESRVRMTTFTRDASQPVTMLQLRYDDRKGLVALGIPVPLPDDDDDVALRATARPFPGDARDGRFAQPPP